jgi:holo-[acyl-carrier protein] synthase
MLEIQGERSAWARSLGGGRLGFDLVQVSQVEQSLLHFGAAYERRLFTPAERDYAHRGAPSVCAERLAARLAAKEAVIKALRLSEAGIAFTDIEVVKLDDGDCEIALHGRVAAIARQQGVAHLLLSMSHDGGYAGAFVSVVLEHSQEASA